MHERNRKLADQLLADLADMNVGPATMVPINTIWNCILMRGGITGPEIASALEWATEAGYLTINAESTAAALTELGYTRSL
jgi:hypothetical protein